MLQTSASFRNQSARAGALAALLLITGGRLYGQAAPGALPPGDGKDLLAVACTQCHGLKPIVILRDGPAGWKASVQEMILRGAQLRPKEADTVIQYLVKNFGPVSSAISGAPKASSLPAGDGKELVEARCSACHGLEKITAEKRSKDEWANTVKNMVDRGLAATPEEIQTMTSYLSAQFGK